MKNASKSNPGMRAEILDDAIKIENDSTIENTVLRICDEEGKPEALLFLEKHALSIF